MTMIWSDIIVEECEDSAKGSYSHNVSVHDLEQERRIGLKDVSCVSEVKGEFQSHDNGGSPFAYSTSSIKLGGASMRR